VESIDHCLVCGITRGHEGFVPETGHSVYISSNDVFSCVLSELVRRYLPYAFTEHSVVMLSAALNSARAVQMSIMVVQAFVRLREMIVANKDLARVEKLEQGHRKTASIIDALVDEIEHMMALPQPSKRKIGFDL
jgi:hypothetical protein